MHFSDTSLTAGRHKSDFTIYVHKHQTLNKQTTMKVKE